MKPFAFFCIFTFVVFIFGCDRDNGVIISPMAINDFQIHVSEIDEEIKEVTMFNERLEQYGENFVDMPPKYYAVTILVRSALGGCRGYKQTRLFYNTHENEITTGSVIWHGNIPWTWDPGSNIILEITESEPIPDGSFDCTDDFYYWHQAIFIGFCIPGEYTIDVMIIEKHLRLANQMAQFILMVIPNNRWFGNPGLFSFKNYQLINITNST